jgi:hypothetical protein
LLFLKLDTRKACNVSDSIGKRSPLNRLNQGENITARLPTLEAMEALPITDSHIWRVVVSLASWLAERAKISPPQWA